MDTLLAFALLFVVLSVAGYGLQFASTVRFIRRQPPKPLSDEPISILKPLCGALEGLAENLESFAQLHYPRFEILIGLKDWHDSALPVARAFQMRHPELAIRIVVNHEQFGFNPKVNNIVPLLQVATHDLVLISDDNVRVAPDYLRETVAAMTEKTGLVYNLIRGEGNGRLGAIFENLHMNSFVIGGVCFLHQTLRHPCVVGKSMLFRRSVLHKIGGLSKVRNVLSEDYVLGRQFQDHGYGVALSSHQIININLNRSLRSFVNRHVRWAKMRFWNGTYRYPSEWLTNPIAASALLLSIDPGLKTTIAFTLVTLGKILLDWFLSRKLTDKTAFRHFLLVPVKDLLIGMLWFAPLISRTVIWRENKLILGRGTHLTPRRPQTAYDEAWEADPTPVFR